MRMNSRTWSSYLVLALVFAGGCLAGWLMRENWPGMLASIDADGNQALLEPSTSAQPGAAQFSRLLTEARFEEAVGLLVAEPDPLLAQQRGQLLDHLARLLDAGQCVVQQQLLDVVSGYFALRPDELILQARCQIAGEQQGLAIDTLYEAMMQTNSEPQLAEIRALISQAVDSHDVALKNRGQWLELDYFYQLLLVQDPGNSSYFQRLANVRQDAGDLDGAVSALLQIQYDPQLGESVRNQLQQLQKQMALIHQQARTIPLQGEGVKLIVDVILDGIMELRLLLDTGAALSVIHPEVLVATGYQLATSQPATFRTANGVISAPVMQISSLAVDDLAQPDLQIGLLSLDLGEGIDGLLGMNYLQHYDFSIDYQARVLYLAPRQ